MKTRTKKWLAVMLIISLSGLVVYGWLWFGMPRPIKQNTVEIPANFNTDWFNWPIDELSHQLRRHPFSSSFRMRLAGGFGSGSFDATAIYNRKLSAIDIYGRDVNERGSTDSHERYTNVTDQMIYRLLHKRLRLEDCVVDGCKKSVISEATKAN